MRSAGSIGQRIAFMERRLFLRSIFGFDFDFDGLGARRAWRE
jgi:hypothetical protein